jgi:hypothetical protein
MIHFISLVAETKNAGRTAVSAAPAPKTDGRKGKVPAPV